MRVIPNSNKRRIDQRICMVLDMKRPHAITPRQPKEWLLSVLNRAWQESVRQKHIFTWSLTRKRQTPLRSPTIGGTSNRRLAAHPPPEHLRSLPSFHHTLQRQHNHQSPIHLARHKGARLHPEDIYRQVYYRIRTLFPIPHTYPAVFRPWKPTCTGYVCDPGEERAEYEDARVVPPVVPGSYSHRPIPTPISGPRSLQPDRATDRRAFPTDAVRPRVHAILHSNPNAPVCDTAYLGPGTLVGPPVVF